jgi:hypothetical protein
MTAEESKVYGVVDYILVRPQLPADGEDEEKD